MTDALGNAGPEWHVTAQQQTVQPVAGGALEQGVNITWILGGTVTGTTFVPAAEATNIDLVRAAIQQAVDAAYARHQLSGTAGQ